MTAITDLTTAVNAAIAELQAAQAAGTEDAQVEALAQQLSAALVPAHVAVTAVTPAVTPPSPAVPAA